MASLRGERLTAAFFARDALVVARALLGAVLVHELPSGERRRARIVETEAYRGPRDAACHAKAGLTSRTRTLFGPPGCAYVYLIYGIFELFNVTCLGEGKGHAVLVRGVEPLWPGVNGRLPRTDGPGRLTRALGITRAHDGATITAPPLYLEARARAPRIAVSPRVGVASAGVMAEAPWRFFDSESPHVSRPAMSKIGLGRVTALRTPPREREGDLAGRSAPGPRRP